MSSLQPATARSAADICGHVSLSREAKELLRDGMTGRAFLDALVQRDDHESAVRVIAHLLAKPAALWWAGLCLWQATRPEPEPAVDEVLRVVLRWLREPSEEHRRTAKRAAETAGGPKTPAGVLALGVTFSGSSMSEPGLPIVPPPEHLSARMTSACVLLSASLGERDELMRHFVRWGLDVADGKNLWQE
jgi:hypothetical protein